ncbi:MAG: glycosyltransferase family 4 protein [Firmicutes bacterium]|nr:glycosyltransferase family 4 protein [Bacillota bacterium]
MKIVWVVRPAEGGIVQHLQHLLDGIPDFEIVLAAPSSLLQSFAGKRRFIPLELADGLSFSQDYAAARRLRRILKREKAQIVHAHGLKAALITASALRFFRSCRFLFTAHNVLPQGKSVFGRCGYSLIQRWMLNGMDTIISVSEAVRSQIVRHVPAAKVVTIHNGIASHRFQGHSPLESRRLQNLPEQAQVVGTVARLIPGKGINTLLESVSLVSKIVPALRLVVVGDGPERERLEKYSRGLGLEKRINFLGWREDVPQLMAAWDCFALPSLNEGFNLSVLEAMASKLPVVVSNLPSLREAVVPGRSGFLISPGNAPELAAALLQLFKEPGRAKAMGEFNLARVKTEFGEEEMVKKTRALYEGLTKP